MSFCAFSRFGLVQFLDQVIDVPVIVLVSGVEKETVEIPQLQFFDKGTLRSLQRLVRQWIHILHQLADGFGRISYFSTWFGRLGS